MSRFLLPLSTSLVMLITPLISHAAGFGINSTRLIYPEGANSITATLRNRGDANVYLVQSSVSRLSASTQAAPFDVTPPLFRMEAESKHQVRIRFRGAELPTDRESVFYFRTTAIPASLNKEDDGSQRLIKGDTRFGVGKSIKLFYRPKNLAGDALSAQRNLRLEADASGLKISNPSPYYVSFLDIRVAGKRLSLDDAEEKMLPPFGSHTWSVRNAKGKVEWVSIDDHGGYHAFSQTLP